MPRTWKESRLTPAQRSVLAWGAAALALCLLMNGYHYSLQGAKGLYVWDKTWLFRALILMGFGPIGFALLSFPLEKLKSTLPARICRGTAIALSVLVGAASVGILGFLFFGPRSGTLEPARILLVNPAKGLGRVERAGAVVGAQRTEIRPATSAQEPLLRLSISSDAHWGAASADAGARAEILASIAERKPDALFLLGDTTDRGAQAEDWNLALMDLESILPKTPMTSLLGNHDALFGGQYLYKKVFFPKGVSTDSGSPYYYSIKDEAATIIVLDLPWGTEEFKARQRNWLVSTLRTADRAKPIVVLSHSYFYASGYDDPTLGKPWYDHYQNIPAVVPILRDYGVSLVVSGHNHYQEFLRKDGIAYAVIGAMGGIPDPSPAHISPASLWRAPAATFGRLDLDFYKGGIVLSFRDAAGALLHEETVSR